MFRVEFLNARHGDCFLVRWDDHRVMLVDGGPSSTYGDELAPCLSQLWGHGGGRRVLDVVCVTHVDDDHIAGVQRLLKPLTQALDDGERLPFGIRQFWFNSVDELVDSQEEGLTAAVEPILAGTADGRAVGASITQGRDVQTRVRRLERHGTRGSPPLVQGVQPVVEGLAVTVIAPDQGALDELVEKWRTTQQTGDPRAVTTAYADRSIPNLSSTVLLVEHHDRTALLTGDARGDRILTGLQSCGLLPDDGPLYVDLLKLPHHGSANNVARGFFEHVHARHYVISADGIKHHHPDEQTLRWLVESRAPDEAYAIHLTNHIPFALDALRNLKVGRGFDISVRPDDEPVLSIDLGEPRA